MSEQMTQRPEKLLRRDTQFTLRPPAQDGIHFFFNDTATTEIYTLSLHDALPISGTTAPSTASTAPAWPCGHGPRWASTCRTTPATRDRKSTRLNSSHVEISY